MRVFLTSPWVPAEWIQAHGLEPRGVWFAADFASDAAPLSAGICGFAQAVVRLARQEAQSAVVFTTHCDQLRRGFDALAAGSPARLFLFNLPATWQTPVAERLYLSELERLGDFLLELGGQAPAPEELQAVVDHWGQARRRLLQAAPDCPALAYAQAVARFHWDGSVCLPPDPSPWPSGDTPCFQSSSLISLNGVGSARPQSSPQLAACGDEPSPPRSGAQNAFDAPGILSPAEARIRLALVGGPLPRGQWRLLELLENAGARVVLNATEAGERSLWAGLPAPDCSDSPSGECLARIVHSSHETPTARGPGILPALRVQTAPPQYEISRLAVANRSEQTTEIPEQTACQRVLRTLARLYLANCVDVFQRPNSRLYAWLRARLEARAVRGIILWAYVGCDLWRAEAQSLREAFGRPLLLLDADEVGSGWPRIAGRLEAFLEVLR